METISNTFYTPVISSAVYYATRNYNEVWRRDKKNKEKIVTFYKKLTECKNDCITFRQAMTRFQILDNGEGGIYNMENDPSFKTVQKTMANIRRKLATNPDQQFLFFYVLAGHGMVMSGRIVLLVNEFSKNTTFYKIWAAEGDIREIAES